MNNELMTKLEQAGLKSTKNELISKIEQAEREVILQALIQKAKQISFSLESVEAQSVVTALSAFTTIPDAPSAERALEHYSQLNDEQQLEYRQQIYAQFIRQSSMFKKLMQKS